jgi:hypothetical protein
MMFLIIIEVNDGIYFSMAPRPEEKVLAGKHPIAHIDIGACSVRERKSFVLL